MLTTTHVLFCATFLFCTVHVFVLCTFCVYLQVLTTTTTTHVLLPCRYTRFDDNTRFVLCYHCWNFFTALCFYRKNSCKLFFLDIRWTSSYYELIYDWLSLGSLLLFYSSLKLRFCFCFQAEIVCYMFQTSE